jgi:Cu(I)/Ag(I) efflux system periplasmic protein CusF
MRLIYAAAVALGLGLAVLAPLPWTASAFAQTQQSQAIDGEVTRVNKDTQKMTIRHGPLPHLDMPAMTMVYVVKDPAMLDQVKAGSKIRFVGDKVDGQFTVLSIESVR